MNISYMQQGNTVKKPEPQKMAEKDLLEARLKHTYKLYVLKKPSNIIEVAKVVFNDHNFGPYWKRFHEFLKEEDVYENMSYVLQEYSLLSVSEAAEVDWQCAKFYKKNNLLTIDFFADTINFAKEKFKK